MKYDKKHLDMFLTLIEKIDKDNGNNWFSASLLETLSNKTSVEVNIISAEINELHSDIKRTKYFLRHIDRTGWLEGFQYYGKIKIPELKIELVKDFKEMKIADMENDIIEFTRRLVMQLENSINCLIELIDAYAIIQKEPANFQDRYNDLHRGDYSFFSINGKKRELKEISLPSKIYFAKQYYSFNYYWKDFDEMVKIRNKSSHRGPMSDKEEEIVENALKNPTQKKVDYFKVFDTIMKNLKDLFL